MLKILLPVDGSTLAMRAVQYAIELTRQGLLAEFVLANVQAPASLYEMVVVHDASALHKVSISAGAHLLAAAQAMLADAGLRFESEVVSGDPAHELIDLVERYACDAIIMGAHGSSALHHTLIGSVSQAVVQAAPVPVTLVKPSQPV